MSSFAPQDTFRALQGPGHRVMPATSWSRRGAGKGPPGAEAGLLSRPCPSDRAFAEIKNLRRGATARSEEQHYGHLPTRLTTLTASEKPLKPTCVHMPVLSRVASHKATLYVAIPAAIAAATPVAP